MKKIIFPFLGLLVLLGIGVFMAKDIVKPVSDDSGTKDFLITKGSSVAKIGSDLEKAGLIRNAIVFKFYVQLTNKQNKIQAGEFSLSPSLSLTEIVTELQKGPKEIWVTIPEGFRREEVAKRFKESLSRDSEFEKEFLNLTLGKEGYLFPDTYLFPKSASAQAIVNKMTSTFNLKVSDVTEEELIMASLLERETITDGEKPVVAGVLYKRLRSGWPLQVDATLQYAKGNWEPVYNLDKEINSPYNTYKFTGLPPTPIASPGKSSIEAAQNPEESDYWYYIHDPKGQIHFARTLDEHNSNISKYLR